MLATYVVTNDPLKAFKRVVGPGCIQKVCRTQARPIRVELQVAFIDVKFGRSSKFESISELALQELLARFVEYSFEGIRR